MATTIISDKKVIQGTSRHYRLTFASAELITEANPEGRVDLTGATVYYRWKQNEGDDNPAEISKSSLIVTEIEILTQSGDTLGQADVWLEPDDTAYLTVGTHYWDAWAILADGTRHAKEDRKVYLQEAVTDLSVPSPSPVAGPIITTVDGGLAIPLLNKTGAVSVKGTLVEASDADDDAVVLCDANSDHPIGVIYQDGIADGDVVYVVVAGVADVLLKDATASTHGNWVSTSDVAGRADATSASPPGLVLTHFREIGHCIESQGAGSDVLARCVLHFN